MRDKGVPAYLGIDFSLKRIEQARQVCPEYAFEVVDVFQTDLLDKHHYDCVLIMEFLEHVEQDIDVLKRLRRGTRVLGTVPNFPAVGHVRYFSNVDEVRNRYAECFCSLRIDVHLGDAQGKMYYLLDAVL